MWVLTTRCGDGVYVSAVVFRHDARRFASRSQLHNRFSGACGPSIGRDWHQATLPPMLRPGLRGHFESRIAQYRGRESNPHPLRERILSLIRCRARPSFAGIFLFAWGRRIPHGAARLGIKLGISGAPLHRLSKGLPEMNSAAAGRTVIEARRAYGRVHSVSLRFVA
jgi:hypothetical protein